MAKKPITKELEHEDVASAFDEDFYDDMEEFDQMAADLLDTAHQQMQIALELTRIIHDNSLSGAPAVDAKKVFDTYRQAVKVVAESSPLANLMEKFV